MLESLKPLEQIERDLEQEGGRSEGKEGGSGGVGGQGGEHLENEWNDEKSNSSGK